MKISVVGAGYVGLVTATCLAGFGFQVVCVDHDIHKIESLKRGDIPIYEPGLDDLVLESCSSGHLSFSTSLPEAVSQSDVVFIAVGTPPRAEDGAADLTYVHGAAVEIAKALSGFTVVVTKSTVPVGTARILKALVFEHNPGADFSVASNPEFLREGSAIDDFLNPDRVVIGCEDERARRVLERLYRPLMLRDVPILCTSWETAELIKYAANAFLASRIGFINEISDLCEVLGADVASVARGIGLDRRIGLHYLHPGPGFGGSCFPKDTRALAAVGRDYGVPLRIVEAVVEANDLRKSSLVDRIARVLPVPLSSAKIALLGVSFKAGTDDVRDSPSLDVIPALLRAGARVCAYDPAAMPVAKPLFPEVNWCSDSYEAAEGAHVVVILTEWTMFCGLDFRRLADVMAMPILVDFRNIYSPLELSDSPMHYYSLGRPPVPLSRS